MSLSTRTPTQFLYPNICVQVGEQSRIGNSHKGCLDTRFSWKWHPQHAGDKSDTNMWTYFRTNMYLMFSTWPCDLGGLWRECIRESIQESLLFHSPKRWSQWPLASKNFETSYLSVGLTPKPCRFFNSPHGEFFYLYESLNKKSWNTTIWLKWAIGPINL